MLNEEMTRSFPPSAQFYTRAHRILLKARTTRAWDEWVEDSPKKISKGKGGI